MTTAARYHHGHLREALVRAAIEAAREQGPDGLALRELARRVGVSHNAAYRHFADRDALVAEVAEHGLTQLTEAGRRRLDRVDRIERGASGDPVRRARMRLVELGRSYVHFALAEPGLFRVVFDAYPRLTTAPGLIDKPHDADPLAQLNAALDGLVDVGFLDPAARPGSEVSCWSAVHGFAVLHLDGPLRQLPADQREAALDLMLLAIDRGYAATTGCTEPLEPLGPPDADDADDADHAVDDLVNDR